MKNQKKENSIKLKALFLIAIVFYIFLISFVNAIPVTSCRQITSPGVYTLSNDLDVYSQNLTLGRCISITVQNVTFDCQYKTMRDYTQLYTSVIIYSNSLNSSIKNCNIMADYGTSIELSGAHNSNVFNNYFFGYSSGISLVNTDNSSFYNLSSIDGGNIIKVSSGSDNNLFYELTLEANQLGSDLLYILNSFNNTFYNFNFTKTNGYSVSIQFSSNNSFQNGSIGSTNTYGVYLDSGLRNTFRQILFNGVNSKFYSAISRDTFIFDSIFDPTYRITLISSDSNITIINSSYSKTLESVAAGSILSRANYLDIKTIDESLVNLSDVSLSIYNISGSQLYLRNSDLQGNTRFVLTEYINNGGITKYSDNYTIFASKLGYSQTNQSINMSGNKNISFSLVSSGVQVVYHPCDSFISGGNQNKVIDSNELKSYVLSHFSAGVSLNNTLYAITLRQFGGNYSYVGNFLSDCNNSPWNCWITI